MSDQNANPWGYIRCEVCGDRFAPGAGIATHVRRVHQADHIGTQQAADAAGITYRQLDYWVRRGWISPTVEPASGSGSTRRWSSDDVARLIRIRELCDGGITVRAAIERSVQ